MEEFMENRISFLKKKRNIAVTALLACVVAVCLFTFAWFFNSRHVNTFAYIEQPTELAIKGPNQTVIEQLDLSKVDLSSETRKASLVFCVTGSVEKYKLELAYTTNVPFTYTIRPTKQTTENSEGSLIYVDKGATYYYPTDSAPLTDGTYINSDGSNPPNATDAKHAAAYGEYDRVQKHAEPLYCLYKGIVPKKQTAGESFTDYYILELSWSANDANHQKETDLVYLLAANDTQESE
jgi:hypothetical protein